MHLKIPPPLVALASGSLILLLTWLWPGSQISIPAASLVSKALGVGGLVLAFLGVFTIGRAKTTISPHRPDRSSALIVSGIFRVSRNPIYLGLALVLLAFGLRKGQPLGAILAVTCFVLYMNRYQIAPEEEALERLYPKEFPAYRANVRRWL